MPRVVTCTTAAVAEDVHHQAGQIVPLAVDQPVGGGRLGGQPDAGAPGRAPAAAAAAGRRASTGSSARVSSRTGICERGFQMPRPMKRPSWSVTATTSPGSASPSRRSTALPYTQGCPNHRGRARPRRSTTRARLSAAIRRRDSILLDIRGSIGAMFFSLPYGLHAMFCALLLAQAEPAPPEPPKPPVPPPAPVAPRDAGAAGVLHRAGGLGGGHRLPTAGDQVPPAYGMSVGSLFASVSASLPLGA